MKKSNFLSIFFCCLLGMTACSDDPAMPKEEETQPTPDGNDEYTPTYEGYEKYMFTLDESQIPTLGGNYEAEKNVPQAKLIGISDMNEVKIDILNDKKIELGFECSMNAVKDHLVIFAKTSSLKDKNSKPKATVVRVKDLEMVSQVTYSLPETGEPDFLVAATADKALLGLSRVH